MKTNPAEELRRQRISQSMKKIFEGILKHNFYTDDDYIEGSDGSVNIIPAVLYDPTNKTNDIYPMEDKKVRLTLILEELE